MDIKSLIIIIWSSLILTSCGVFKDKKLSKKDEKLTEKIVEKTIRKGDTVTFLVPKVVHKDTTIYTYNRVGTKIITRFNNEGKIDSVACIASALEKFTEINRELVKSIKDKEKKEELKTSQTFIYIIGGTIFLILFYLIYRVESVLKIKP